MIILLILLVDVNYSLHTPTYKDCQRGRKNMNVVIIDDEILAVSYLEDLLRKIDDIQIVGKFTDPLIAFKKIVSLQVDVVFLDMEMGEMHGLEVAEKIMETFNEIEIIFVTAYPSYALKAFEVNAIDYLMKPVRLDRLTKAITKVRQQIKLYNYKNQYSQQSSKDLYICSLGSFRLLNGQQNVIKWRTRKVQELFVFLWHHQNKPVHKARIIEELWSDTDMEKAVALLHTTVYQLRRTFKENNIEKSVVLKNDRYHLFIQIESDMNKLEKILYEEDPSVENIKKILRLYVGDYLEEESYPWIIQKQHQLKNLVLNYLESFLKKKSTHHVDHLFVEQCLEKMFQLDPMNETNIIRLINHYGETRNKNKIQSLFHLVNDTFTGDLNMGFPSNIMNTFKRYLR